MKGNQRFLLHLLAAALVLALVWAGGRDTDFAAGQSPADDPATHNMLVVGEETVYLSHLPMFQEEKEPPMPHRYQVILEVVIAEQQAYVKDRREHAATKIYTLNPERFVLPNLASSDPQHKPLDSFEAKSIFRGHLEREDSAPILQNVGVNVKRVIYFRRFVPKAQKPLQLEYLLFGKGQELFLAHMITSPPDFDQVLSVKVTGHQFTDEERARGMLVVFPGTKNTAGDRIKAGQRMAGEVMAGSPETNKKIQVDVGSELYFEEGELRVPPVFDTTPEEKLAGFP